MQDRDLVAVALGALLLVSLLAPLLALPAAPAAAQGNSSTPTPDAGQQDDDDDGYSLEDLQRDGQHPADSPESVRQHQDSMYWLIYWPARALWADVGSVEDDEWLFVGEDGAVSDNEVYLRTINTGRPKEMDLTIVSYRVEQRTVETDGGSTTTERVAADVVERDVTVTLSPGWSIAEVSIPDLEEPRRVTIIADDAPQDLRWTFRHDPVATSRTAPIENEGDYLWRVGKHVFFPAVFGIFAIGLGVRWAIRRAGTGPKWGLGQWVGLVVLVLVLGYIFGPVESTADLLVYAPVTLAALLVLLTGIVALETWEDGASDVLFVKPDVEPITSPAGKEALDAIVAGSDDEKVVEMPDGTTAVIRPGLRPFLARLFGSAARIRGADLMNCSVELEGSSHDELVFCKPDGYDPDNDEDLADLEDPDEFETDDVDAEADARAGTAIDFSPEGWNLEAPPLDSLSDAIRALAIVVPIGAAGLAVYGFLGPWYGSGVAGGLLLAWLATPVDGYAHVEPAPGHLRSAMITAMVMSSEVADAETLDEARKQNIRLRGQSERDVEEALASQDATLVEALLRGGEDSDPLERSIVEGIPADGEPHNGAPDADDPGDDAAGEGDA